MNKGLILCDFTRVNGGTRAENTFANRLILLHELLKLTDKLQFYSSSEIQLASVFLFWTLFFDFWIFITIDFQENGIDAACGRSAAPRNVWDVTLSHIFCVQKRLLRFMSLARLAIIELSAFFSTKTSFYEAALLNDWRSFLILVILVIPAANFLFL